MAISPLKTPSLLAHPNKSSGTSLRENAAGDVQNVVYIAPAVHKDSEQR